MRLCPPTWETRAMPRSINQPWAVVARRSSPERRATGSSATQVTMPP
jgi:hypothetical protein